MKTTYLGHSTLLVETAGTRLLFDPFISPNPLAAAIDIEGIGADYVLLSHGHADHVADAEAILKRTGATLISNYEIVTWFGGKGIEKAHPLNHGGGFVFPFGRVDYVAAVHSSVLPDGTYGGNPGGFVVTTDEGSFYFSGDTALTMDMKILAEKYELSWAALCLGDNFTMGPRDAATAARWVGAKEVIGMHFDTFPPIAIDHASARAEFANAGVKLHLLQPGETIDVG
jgi:L-ascorbate metabolism protein UlaG (beta-lactamase superfamily)